MKQDQFGKESVLYQSENVNTHVTYLKIGRLLAWIQMNYATGYLRLGGLVPLFFNFDYENNGNTFD